MTRWGKTSGTDERRLLSLRGVEIGPMETAALDFVGPVPVTKRAWIVIYTALKEVPKGEVPARLAMGEQAPCLSRATRERRNCPKENGNQTSIEGGEKSRR